MFYMTYRIVLFEASHSFTWFIALCFYPTQNVLYDRFLDNISYGHIRH